MTAEFKCPKCGQDFTGEAWEDVQCPACATWYHTDGELVDSEEMTYSFWITGEVENAE